MNADQRKKKVLVIDDNPDILDLITGPIIAQNYEVVTATDGDLALRAVTQHNPDLIVADLTMPNLNGWRFCQKLRQEEKYAPFKGTPIIVLSALVGKEGPPDKMDLADYYLAKPFDHKILLDKIKELLKEA